MSVIRGNTGVLNTPDIPMGVAMAENCPVYIDSSGNGQKARANAIATYARGIISSAVSAADIAAGGDRVKRSIIKFGTMDGFTGLTIGADVYLDAAAAGGFTQTQPTQPNVVQPCGVALSATQIEFWFLSGRPLAIQTAANSNANIV